jgi:hypothetical protein
VDEAEAAHEACARRMTERRANTAMNNGNYWLRKAAAKKHRHDAIIHAVNGSRKHSEYQTNGERKRAANTEEKKLKRPRDSVNRKSKKIA